MQPRPSAETCGPFMPSCRLFIVCCLPGRDVKDSLAGKAAVKRLLGHAGAVRPRIFKRDLRLPPAAFPQFGEAGQTRARRSDPLEFVEQNQAVQTRATDK